MPTYPPGYSGPLPAGLIGLSEVIWYDFDFQPDNVKAPDKPMLFAGEVILGTEVVVGTGLAIGNGVDQIPEWVSPPIGAIDGWADPETPPAVDYSLNGSTLVRVWLWVNGASVGSTVIVNCKIQASLGRRISKPISLRVVER